MAITPKYSNRIGTYITSTTAGKSFKAYNPKSLPPNPPLAMDTLLPALEKADYSLGQLDGTAKFLPAIDMFLYCYVRKEALLSSQIEGTQSTLADLLLFETKAKPGVPIEDVKEVSNYVAAIGYGLARLKQLPVSLRLIKEMHYILLRGTRGQAKTPGEFRRTQNWIGGLIPSTALFVPPPPQHMRKCLGDLEIFIHGNSELPTLIKIALIHVQFETIHPFLDGNGRLGRLLITLLLYNEGLLKQPLLYLSLYFKANRNRYYELLQEVRTKGAWEKWVLFFLAAVKETSAQATQSIDKGMKLITKDANTIKQLATRSHTTPTMLHKYLQKHMIASIPKTSSDLKMTQATITKAFLKLVDLGIVKEITGKHRGRIFVYKKYFSILDQGTEQI